MGKSMKFNRDMPIYLQLYDFFRCQILSGKLHPGTRFPSIRKIANEAQVNSHTVQHAMAFLKRDDLLEKRKGKGYSVTDDTEKIRRQRQLSAENAVKSFLYEMEVLGFSKEQIMSAVIYML